MEGENNIRPWLYIHQEIQESFVRVIRYKICPIYGLSLSDRRPIWNRKQVNEENDTTFRNYKKDNWNERLGNFEVAYNFSPNATTIYSPFFVKYGIHPAIVPIDNMTQYNLSATRLFYEICERTKFVDGRIVE